jgi:hypothetical protein
VFEDHGLRDQPFPSTTGAQAPILIYHIILVAVTLEEDLRLGQVLPERLTFSDERRIPKSTLKAQAALVQCKKHIYI